MSVEREPVERGIWKRRTVGGQWAYEISYRDSDGRQRRQTVHGGKRAARVALADVQARRGKGERVTPMPRLTFGMAAARWSEAQGSRLRPATQAKYDSALRIHLLPRWRYRRLDSLSVDDVARLVEELGRAGKSAWTIRGVLVVLGRVIDFARRRLGWVGENPVRSLDRSERPRSDQRERRVLTAEELDAVLKACRGHFRLAVLIAAMTGARLGEVLGLRWRNIDLDAATATIDAQLGRDGELAEPKTAKAHRTVDLPRVLVSELRAYKLRSPMSRPGDFVLLTRNGRPLDHRALTQAYGRAIKAAELAEPKPSFHSLRHTFASRYIASGGDLVSLSVHLGHSSPKVTAERYVAEFERAARSDERRARLDAMFGGSTMAATDRDTNATDEPEQGGEVLKIQAIRESA